MPCCMLGALFLGQCIAALVWVRKLLGLRPSGLENKPNQRVLEGPWGKWIVLALSVELAVLTSVYLFADQKWLQHEALFFGFVNEVEEGGAELCGAEQPLVSPFVDGGI